LFFSRVALHDRTFAVLTALRFSRAAGWRCAAAQLAVTLLRTLACRFALCAAAGFVRLPLLHRLHLVLTTGPLLFSALLCAGGWRGSDGGPPAPWVQCSISTRHGFASVGGNVVAAWLNADG
jgi:hypothetical protein